MSDRNIILIGFNCFSGCLGLGSFAIKDADIEITYTGNACAGSTYASVLVLLSI